MTRRVGRVPGATPEMVVRVPEVRLDARGKDGCQRARLHARGKAECQRARLRTRGTKSTNNGGGGSHDDRPVTPMQDERRPVCVYVQ